MMLVLESPMRYATCTSSGEVPSSMNMGTNTGAITAHLAEALPMKRLINPDRTMNASMRGMAPNPKDLSREAPSMASVFISPSRAALDEA